MHANSCYFKEGILMCECDHNTTGQDCGKCKRNYKAKSWRPGNYSPYPMGTANSCTYLTPSYSAGMPCVLEVSPRCLIKKAVQLYA